MLAGLRVVAVSQFGAGPFGTQLLADLGAEVVKIEDLPAVVCCSLSGFGATGPRAAEPAFDYLIQGYAGWMSVTGEPDGPPGKCGVSVVDFAGGYASMAALLAGLWDAQRSGIGRDIDISLLDTAVSMLSYFAIWSLNRDWQAERVAESGHQSLVPAQNFPTRDGWIVVFCNKEKFWQALVDALGLPEVARDPRFATFADRLAHKDALLPLLRTRFAERTTEEWLRRLRGRVPCAPVNTLAQALADEQVRARGMIIEVEHPRFGRLREVASPVRTDGVVASPAPAPRLGAHTDEILGGLLGYDTARIAALRAAGALGRAP
jgi:crotonobetainyl-CoA:carnitine CoA-transferase CaiB-like acyl-CoA transferase